MISLFASTCRGTGAWSLLRTRGLPDSSTDLCLPGAELSAQSIPAGPADQAKGIVEFTFQPSLDYFQLLLLCLSKEMQGRKAEGP